MCFQEFVNVINYWEVKVFFYYQVGGNIWFGLGVGIYYQYQNYENFRILQVQKEFCVWVEGFQKVMQGCVIFEYCYWVEYCIIGKFNMGMDDFVMNMGINFIDCFCFWYCLQFFVFINYKVMEV